MDLANSQKEILSLKKKIAYLKNKIKKNQTKIPTEKLRIGRTCHFMAKSRQQRQNRADIAFGIEKFSQLVGQIGKSNIYVTLLFRYMYSKNY